MDRKLHLHARRIIFPHPRAGVIDISAPMPDHMLRTFETAGLRPQPLRGGAGVKLAIFDVDGTLVDSSTMIAASLTTAFRAEGLAVPDRTRMMSIVGLSLLEAMKVLAPDEPHAAHERLGAAYKQAFWQHRASGQPHRRPVRGRP